MMKHPKYRVRDGFMGYVLAPEVWQEVFDFVWAQVRTLPFADRVVDVEWVGSGAFGCMSLASDLDFNIKLKDWNEQVPARRWFYGERNRAAIIDACFQFEKKTGLKIDIGCVDCESEKYNIFISTKDLVIYNRGIAIPPYTPSLLFKDTSTSSVAPNVPTVPQPTSVDMKTFTIGDPIPPATVMHLTFDNYIFRWLVQPRTFERNGRWIDDPWKDEIPYWRSVYGDTFITYHEENGSLVEDAWQQ